MTSRAEITITERGLDGMIRALRHLQGQAQAEAQQHLDSSLRRTAEISRSLAHVDPASGHTGALRDSIHPTSEHGSGHWTGEVRASDRGAGYEFARGGTHSEFITSLAHLSNEDFQSSLDRMFKGL